MRFRFEMGAAVLTATTFLSYLTGLLRDRIFARTFGAGRELDLYNASFTIPDLLLNIFVMSVLSAAFIPTLSGLLAQKEQEKANMLANATLRAAVAAILVLGGLAALFMPILSRFIGKDLPASDLAILTHLSRLMLISPMFMAVSNTFGAMLVSSKRFLAYGLSPVFYNLGIISGVLLTPRLGIFGLVAGTLFGAFLHTAPRIFALRTSPFRWLKHAPWKNRDFIDMIKLGLPKMAGHPVEPLTFMAFTRIALPLAAGSVTAVSFARNFQSVPVSLFGISFSVAVYPVLAAAVAKKNASDFLKSFKKSLRDILLLTIPSALGLYFLSEIPIRLFLGGGKFSDENILRTAHTLSLFALSIPTESAVHLLARSFYALKNTVIPVIMSVIGLIVCVSFASTAVDTLGIAAIPLGFFAGSAVETALLSFILARTLKKFTALQ
ncbi:hypothetical protein HYV58_01685 [Candidatus Peregrinibacteria bacterium]|nr:hypothetical protein [Candidatus Peregrinibacteria bacterium]